MDPCLCLAVDPVFPGGHDLVEIPVNMKILFVQAPAAHEASPMEVELKRAIHNAQQLGVGVSLSLILGGRQFDFDDLAVDIGGGMAAAEERVEGRVARAARVEEGWEAVVATVARLEARVEAAEADARAAEAAAVVLFAIVKLNRGGGGGGGSGGGGGEDRGGGATEGGGGGSGGGVGDCGGGSEVRVGDDEWR